MCGICGEIRFDANRVDPDTIQAMLAPLQRRGPDHEGRFVKGPVGLGHRRLSIIDLSEKGNQPITDSQSNTSIVFNGTIYNYPQLRSELQKLGHQFVSSGDTEIILKSYLQWGEECVNRFVGIFSFAIWNESSQEIFLARDRLGVKPLYFMHEKNFFRFASNSQALLATKEVNTEFDIEGLHYHFTLHAVVPAPNTILKGIKKLTPGHCLTIGTNGKTKQKKFWELRANQIDTSRSEQDWITEIRDSLMMAVERRLNIADVPVGVLLSGGLDSSLLVGLLAEKNPEAVKTYSVGFEDQPEELGNEFVFSDAVVEQFNTDHHKFYIHNSEVLNRIPEVVEQMAEPMVGQDVIGFYLLAEQVSQQISVVQSGQGADEVFGGYSWYPKMFAEPNFSVKSFARHYFDRDHTEMGKMLHQEYIEQDFTKEKVNQLLEGSKTNTFIDAVFHMDITTLIVDDPVKRVDNMTMAHGLEARVPYLDHELVELVMQMPAEYKLKQDGKYILKKIAAGLLPDTVIHRRKQAFPVPALIYVRDEFSEFMKSILFSEKCASRGLFKLDYINAMLKEPEHYLTPLKGNKLWHMALLELWLQRNVDTC